MVWQTCNLSSVKPRLEFTCYIDNVAYGLGTERTENCSHLCTYRWVKGAVTMSKLFHYRNEKWLGEAQLVDVRWNCQIWQMGVSRVELGFTEVTSWCQCFKATLRRKRTFCIMLHIQRTASAAFFIKANTANNANSRIYMLMMSWK